VRKFAVKSFVKAELEPIFHFSVYQRIISMCIILPLRGDSLFA